MKQLLWKSFNTNPAATKLGTPTHSHAYAGCIYDSIKRGMMVHPDSWLRTTDMRWLKSTTGSAEKAQEAS
jgi:hypothetical protein